VVAELFAVVGRDDDQRVVPLAAVLDGAPHAPELFIDVADHAVVLRPHPASTRLVGRGPSRIELHREVVKRVPVGGGFDGEIDLVLRVCRRPPSGRGIRRMGAQVAQVHEPAGLLPAEPRQKAVGEERRDAEFGGALWLRAERLLRVHLDVIAVVAEVRDPRFVRLGDEQLALEAREDPLKGPEPPVVGACGVAWISRLVGVAEQGRPVAGAAREHCHVVESPVERRTVGDDAVVHLIGARVQTRATR